MVVSWEVLNQFINSGTWIDIESYDADEAALCDLPILIPPVVSPKSSPILSTDALQHQISSLTLESKDMPNLEKQSPSPPSQDQTKLFSELALKPEIVRGLEELGFSQCTQVQSVCLPHALIGKDVVCQAMTGAGKTLVFVLAILQKLTSASGLQAVVIAHSAELVAQIFELFQSIGKYLSYMRIMQFHDHSEKRKQTVSIGDCNIIIGIPAKVQQVVTRMSLRSKPLFVMDEADRLYYKEEEERIREIYNSMPNSTQAIFTATVFSREVRQMVKQMVDSECFWLEMEDKSLIPPSLSQFYLPASDIHEKVDLLKQILERFQFNQLIIFVNTVHRAEQLSKLLDEDSYLLVSMHSNRDFSARLRDIHAFKNFEVKLMVTTDVLSRGIDADYVNIVVNFDMAQKSDTYLRRIGRAARNGRKGMAISFIESSADRRMKNEVEDRFGTKISRLPKSVDASEYMEEEEDSSGDP